MAQQHAISYEQPFQGAMPAGFTLCRILSDSRGGKIRKIAWSPDGGILTAVFFDKLVCLWDAQTGNIIQRLAEQGEPAYCLAWSPTLPLLALGFRDGNIQLWNTQTWELSQVPDRA